MVSILEVPVVGVRDREAEHPPRPVFDGDDAANLVALVLAGHVLERRAVEVGKPVLDEDVAVAE